MLQSATCRHTNGSLNGSHVAHNMLCSWAAFIFMRRLAILLIIKYQNYSVSISLFTQENEKTSATPGMCAALVLHTFGQMLPTLCVYNIAAVSVEFSVCSVNNKNKQCAGLFYFGKVDCVFVFLNQQKITLAADIKGEKCIRRRSVAGPSWNCPSSPKLC